MFLKKEKNPKKLTKKKGKKTKSFCELTCESYTVHLYHCFSCNRVHFDPWILSCPGTTEGGLCCEISAWNTDYFMQ